MVSMQLNFRIYHLFRILGFFEKSTLPIDFFLKKYFQSHKQLGSKDRKEICEILYSMIRYKGLIEFSAKKPLTPENCYSSYQKILARGIDKKLPPYLQVSFPKNYFDLLKKNFGLEKALEICAISNTQAPTTVRINPLLTTREKLYEKWKDQYSIELGKTSPLAICFKKKIGFFSLPEYKQGLFEIQDEGSQLIGFLVKPKPKDHVLDYCAGSGGKTLAFAHRMEGKGQIYLHDIRSHALLEAKKRLKRAHIHNAQLLMPESKKTQLKEKMDWVLVDAPCSGSGTLRRNPDMKWRFSDGMIEKLTEEQQIIFKDALSFTKKGGHIVYATCSIFSEENEMQVKRFLDTHSLSLKEMISWLPEKEGMDGFFGAVFQKN